MQELAQSVRELGGKEKGSMHAPRRPVGGRTHGSAALASEEPGGTTRRAAYCESVNFGRFASGFGACTTVIGACKVKLSTVSEGSFIC